MKLIHFLTTAMLTSVFLLGCVNNIQTATQSPINEPALTVSPVVGIEGPQDNFAIYQAAIQNISRRTFKIISQANWLI
jgi:hypothetical protein